MKIKPFGRTYKRIVCWLLAFVMVSGSSFGALSLPAHAADDNGSAHEQVLTQLEMYEAAIAAFGERFHFSDYLARHASAARPDFDLTIDAADYIIAEGMYVEYLPGFYGADGISVWTGEQGLIEWEFNAPAAGLYNISVKYFNAIGRNSDIQRAIFINGEQPFFESNPVELRRTWVNRYITWWCSQEGAYRSGYVRQDSQGNDMRPTQVEYHTWSESTLRDSMGTYNEYLSFFFNEGRNTIGFLSLREPMVIRHVRVHQAPVTRPYAELASGRAGLNRPTTATVAPIRIEGQDAVRKSSPMLAPIANTGGPGVTPHNPRYILINSIGGGSWSSPGSWIEWEVEVPEAGLYSIAVNALQNFQRGAMSFRRITINGRVPFEEMEAFPFAFHGSWRVHTLGTADEPFLFWLEAGTNTIRMETVLGDYAAYLREVQEVSLNLSGIYREIVMRTGLSPDLFRDYQLGQNIHNLQPRLQENAMRLRVAHASLTTMAPGRGDRDAMLNSTASMLARMYNNIENIPRRIGDFNINIASLGTWSMIVRDQPLAIDAIYILPHDAPMPRNGYSWWRQVWHELLTLFWSFFIDFNAVGIAEVRDDMRRIEVWIGTGRDQANVIKSLIDETFTNETNIGVTLMLTDPGTLLPATIAGQGPDVALSVWNSLPMDFGLRGGVADISGMPGFEDVAARFHPAAMTPYEFEGRVFALPETLTFSMLFYRRDILYDIGLEPPDSWDEVRSAIAHLSQFHMEFGLPVTLPAVGGVVPIDIADVTFTMFLYQRGGALYNATNTASALDSDVSLNAFRDFTRFFTDYNLPVIYDFVNRFRRGDMPLAIADYGNFNALQVFAPEIRGLWGFRPVPGTIREDGSLDRTVPGGGMAVVMMESASDKDAAWEFMKWWTSADTQTMFGQRMEALMGPAARHPTANMEAFSRMPWPIAEYNNLRYQMEWTKGIPQIPGAYFTPRQIRNAFFSTVEVGDIGPREALTDFTRFINDEIRAKRREFGLD